MNTRKKHSIALFLTVSLLSCVTFIETYKLNYHLQTKIEVYESILNDFVSLSSSIDLLDKFIENVLINDPYLYSIEVSKNKVVVLKLSKGKARTSGVIKRNCTYNLNSDNSFNVILTYKGLSIVRLLNIVFLLLFILIVFMIVHYRLFRLCYQNKKDTYSYLYHSNIEPLYSQMNDIQSYSFDELVSKLAHNMNTPLGIALTLSSEINFEDNEIINDLMDSTLTKRKLEDFLESTSTLSEILIANINKVSFFIDKLKRLSENQYLHEKKMFNINSYIHDSITCELFKITTNQECAVKILCSKMLYVNTYFDVLDQVFFSLVSHSVNNRFSTKRNRMIEVEVVYSRNLFKILYRDNGGPISNEKILNIFEPFTFDQSNSFDSSFDLYTSKKLIESIFTGSFYCRKDSANDLLFIIEIPLSKSFNLTMH